MKSGWSAPPEVFQEKSLLEIEEEKRKNVKHKKQAAPKQHDFPTLGKFYRGHNFYRGYLEKMGFRENSVIKYNLYCLEVVELANQRSGHVTGYRTSDLTSEKFSWG